MGYEDINIQGTRIYISGVQGYEYPGYEDIYILGTRKYISEVRGMNI